MFASSGIEPEVTAKAESLEILPGVQAQVASIGHLVALKLLAQNDRTRPQDADDIRALRRVATPEDVAQAREAVALIEARGYHRSKDLTKALDALSLPSASK